MWIRDQLYASATLPWRQSPIMHSTRRWVGPRGGLDVSLNRPLTSAGNQTTTPVTSSP